MIVIAFICQIPIAETLELRNAEDRTPDRPPREPRAGRGVACDLNARCALARRRAYGRLGAGAAPHPVGPAGAEPARTRRPFS